VTMIFKFAGAYEVFEPRDAPAYFVEDEPGPVAVLDRGRVDDDVHRQRFTADQGVDFAALHLVAGIAAHLVVGTAPFSADLTDWLSRPQPRGWPPGPSARAALYAATLPPIDPTVLLRPHRRSLSRSAP
jgi:hypothetical protein